jgi:Tfp pilus assembly protein PilX
MDMGYSFKRTKLAITKENGSVLFSAIVYLLLLSIIAIAAYEHSFLSNRLSNNHWQSVILASVTEDFLSDLEKQIVHNEGMPCLVPSTSANYYYKLAKGSWRQMTTCQNNKNEVELSGLVEKLQTEPCVYYLQNKKQYQGITLYRVTVHGELRQSFQTQQSIITAPDRYKMKGYNRQNCSGKITSIKLGRISWRQR